MHAGPRMHLASDRSARWIVWGGFAALLLGSLAFAPSFGVNVPYWDEWRFVPAWFGDEAPSAHWAWVGHNGHRYPLPRWALYVTTRITGDLRVGMLLSTVVLAAACAMCLVSVARVRGRTSVSDLFFPLLLLHGGQQPSLLVSINLHFAAATALAVALMALVARGGSTPTWSAALCLLLLPIHSAIGLVLAGPFVLWLAWAVRRARGAPRRGVLMVLLALTVALVVLYFIDLRRGAPPDPNGVSEILRTTLQFLGMGVGLVGRDLWPWGALGVAALAVGTAAWLLGIARGRADQRVQALGLLAGIAAVGGLALVIGHGRSEFGWEAGLKERYVTLACPMLVAVYLAWVRHGGPRLATRGPALLAMALLVLLPLNTLAGVDRARAHRALLVDFETDLRAGASTEELVERFGERIAPRPAELPEAIDILREGRGLAER